MSGRTHKQSSPAQVLALATLDGAFTGKGWQGATLSGALRGISAREALWRPGAGRRCIWEHVLHAAYWKYALLNVFSPGHGVTFDRSPSNWPEPPLAGKAGAGGAAGMGIDERMLEKQWKADRAYLAAMHERLRDAVGAFDFSRIGEKAGAKKRHSYAQFIAGAAAHDAYHCGQVQLIKRLLPD